MQHHSSGGPGTPDHTLWGPSLVLATILTDYLSIRNGRFPFKISKIFSQVIVEKWIIRDFITCHSFLSEKLFLMTQWT